MGKDGKDQEEIKRNTFQMSYQYGALKTAPMESAQGKFGWENYQLEENLGLPIQCPIFTHWEACLGAARSKQKNTQAFKLQSFIKTACKQRNTHGTEHQEALTGMKITKYHSTPAHA